MIMGRGAKNLVKLSLYMETKVAPTATPLSTSLVLGGGGRRPAFSGAAGEKKPFWLHSPLPRTSEGSAYSSDRLTKRLILAEVIICKIACLNVQSPSPTYHYRQNTGRFMTGRQSHHQSTFVSWLFRQVKGITAPQRSNPSLPDAAKISGFMTR